MHIPSHRQAALNYIHGLGLEIGALHEPFPLPPGSRVKYADAIDKKKAMSLFPEIDATLIVTPDYIIDLDVEGFAKLDGLSFDFVIASHVLEHLANPIGTLNQIFAILKPGGVAVIAIPDMRFTFDRHRPLTPFEHVWGDYINKTTASSDEHYVSFLRSAAPHVFKEPADLQHHIDRARERREHSHVWTSDSFKEMMSISSERLGLAIRPLFESPADQNLLEYFSVWEKAN